MVLSSFEFDDKTPDQAVSASPPWYLSSGGSETITALAAAAVHGPLGGRISSASSYRGVYYREPQTTDTRVIDFYVRPTAVPANAYIMALLDGTTNRADVRINSAGTVAIRNAFVAVATSTETLALDGTVTYRFAWKVSTTGQELRVYVGESTTPLFTLSGALTNASHTDIGAGLTAASAGFTADFDTIRIADDWLAPFGADTPLDLFGRRKTADGWTDLATPSRWDGTAWVLLATAGPVASLSPTIDSLTAPVIAAHRIGGNTFPENTKYAADKALADPAMGGELDVVLTSDGVLVLSHDLTVDRTAANGETGAVASYTAAAFTAIEQVWPAGSTWTPQPEVFASTWADIADEYGGKRLLIVEGKTNNAATQLVDDIVSRGIEDRTLLISFSETHCAYAESQGVRSILTYAGTTPDFSVAQSTGCWGACIYTGAATVEQIADANARGLKVLVLQVTSVAQMNTYLSRGAFGFISDEPWTLAQTAPPPDTP